nr:transposase [Hornefia butyriciproducens]
MFYRKGITTREIADLIEKIYGHCYSPATVSNISMSVADQVETFHKRSLSEKYVVIFMDAIYLNVRRDSVAKEPLHVLLGITPDGHGKSRITRCTLRNQLRITRR